MDEPSSLPDGTVIDLVMADDVDDLGDDERALLHAALTESWESARAGRTRPIEELLEAVRSEE